MRELLRRWWWLPPLALLTAISWGPALVGPFQFDDHAVILDYTPVHTLAGWWQAQPGLRPLLKLSYALNWQASPSPSSFHLVNLCIHVACALLLMGWLRRVLPVSHAPVAVVVALLWFFHPATTEAVTYISGRSVSLASLFALLALYVNAGEARWRGLVVALCTVAAIATRETFWVLPAALWLVEWLRGRTALVAWQRTAPAWILLLLAAALLLAEANHRELLASSFAERGGVAQFWTQIEAWRYFIALALLWQAPNIDPDLPRHAAMTLPLLLQALVLAGIALLALWRVIFARSFVAGGVLWFCLWLLPTNGLLPRQDVASDRHAYLALAGLLWAGWLLFETTRLARWRTPVAVALVMLLAACTLARNLDYSDEVSLWQRTLQQAPRNARAWNNLGMAQSRAGESAAARDAFTRALALDPSMTRARVNLWALDHP